MQKKRKEDEIIEASKREARFQDEKALRDEQDDIRKSQVEKMEKQQTLRDRLQKQKLERINQKKIDEEERSKA
jgi:hypothetical protein